MTAYTTPEQIEAAYATLQGTFKTCKTKSLAWRKWQLKQIWWMVSDHEETICRALHSDLHRHDLESYFMDIGGIKQDLLLHINNFETWATDEVPDAGFLFSILCGARIRKEPLGIALILGTWNFPFVVTLSPLVAAVSAGCAVMVKPSEVATASQNLMADLIPKYLDPEAIQVVMGGPQETEALLQRQFDAIFYTGSPKIARSIATAAARNLTPTVLELGGQAPCIVTPSANINLAAKRITYSKFLNSGQICLAANHVFADPEIYDQFVERAIYWLGQFLKGSGEDDGATIVNERNYDRLVALLNQSAGKIAFGGNKSREKKHIQPTLITDVNTKDSLFSEEIFGPLLPVMPLDYRTACDETNKLPHALGLYIFSSSQSEIDYILSHTISGGVTVNDIMLHAAVPNAPFGGVGNSGTGAYHGRYGFDAFSHRRTVVNVPGWMDRLVWFRYPPYDRKHIAKLQVKNPGFKKGDMLEDHRVGKGFGATLLSKMSQATKLCALAVLLALIDAKMGGKPGSLEILAAFLERVKEILPV